MYLDMAEQAGGSSHLGSGRKQFRIINMYFLACQKWEGSMGLRVGPTHFFT